MRYSRKPLNPVFFRRWEVEVYQQVSSWSSFMLPAAGVHTNTGVICRNLVICWELTLKQKRTKQAPPAQGMTFRQQPSAILAPSAVLAVKRTSAPPALPMSTPLFAHDNAPKVALWTWRMRLLRLPRFAFHGAPSAGVFDVCNDGEGLPCGCPGPRWFSCQTVAGMAR